MGKSRRQSMEEFIAEHGAREVWLVDAEGMITYFSNHGQIDASKEL